MRLKLTLSNPPNGECKIPKRFLGRTSLEFLLMFDCFMNIKVGDKLFYDDYICPLEMRYAYLEWCKNYAFCRDFIYNTEDDSNNPILMFKSCCEGWKIISTHSEYDCDEIFDYDDISGFFMQFENQLKKFLV